MNCPTAIHSHTFLCLVDYRISVDTRPHPKAIIEDDNGVPDVIPGWPRVVEYRIDDDAVSVADFWLFLACLWIGEHCWVNGTSASI